MSALPPMPPPGQEVRFIFTTGPLEIRAALCSLVGVLAAFRVREDVRGAIETSMAEILNNIATHAYRGGPGRVEIRLRMGPSRIAFVVLDKGAAMPGGCPPHLSAPRRPAPGDELPEGRFGWVLIHALCRDLAYRRAGSQNRLSFEFPLDVCAEENAANLP